MSEPRLVDPRPTGAPVGGPPDNEALPDDLALEAAGRLRAACLVLGSLWTALLVVNHLVAPYLGLPQGQVIPWPPVANVLALGCIALSVLVYRRAPADAVAGARLPDVAIAYEVAMAFAIGIINQWQPQVLAGRLSWLCVLILVFPSIVPAAPRKVLVG